MKYFVANWKSHKTVYEGKKWLTDFQKLLQDNPSVQNKLTTNEISIVICPPYHLLYPLKEQLANYPNYSLGSQNISPFPDGSYTGEIAPHMIQNLINFVIIGHSERRKYFHEDDGDIELRVDATIDHSLQPILCVRSEHDEMFTQVKIVAYEPVESIGTGQNAPIKDVLEMKKKLQIDSTVSFLYGGSVDEHNSAEYIKTEGIDGLLIGSASLDPNRFFSIITSYS